MTVSPDAGVGIASGVHPFAVTTFTVGMSEWRGSGICGFGPIPAETGSRADPPQAASRRAEWNQTARRRRGCVRMEAFACERKDHDRAT